MKTTTRINIFAGPGAGKTTTASGLFFEMKKMNMDVEITHEFAKELVYTENLISLGNQLLVSGEQIRRNELLEGRVEYIINDSPTILGSVYIQKNAKEYEKILVDKFKESLNINIFLERNKNNQFVTNGRNQNLKESIELDNKILDLLNRNCIQYYKVLNDENVIDKILSVLRREKFLN